MFALAIVFFVCKMKKFPIFFELKKEWLNEFLISQINWDELKVSDNFKDLFTKMAEVNPENRITLEEIS